MKNVTIPTCANPFVVIVNGIKYTYPAGETVEVPDDVAAVIEQHHDAHNNPKPEPVTPPYDGGASSWNDLEDKPFGDEKVTIEWDGNTEGRVVVPFGDGDETSLVKVSDLTPEPDTFVGGSFGVTAEGEVGFMQITAETIEDFRSEGVNAIMVGGGAFFVIYADGTNVDRAVFPEKGIYFIYVDGVQYNSSLTYGSIKKLDPKFLPEGGVGYDDVKNMGDTLTWDGTPSDTAVPIGEVATYHHVSDNAPSVDELLGKVISVTVVGDDEPISLELTEESVNPYGEDLIFAGGEDLSAMVVANVDGATAVFDVGASLTLTFPKKGVYFLYANSDGVVNYASSLTIAGYNFTKTTTHKIAPKYLPIIKANSKAELPDPSTVAEGTIALVPSEGGNGGGGLPVVEIATLPTEEGVLLTEEEAAKMNALNGGMCVLKVNYVQDDVGFPVTAYPSIIENGPILLYMCVMLNWYVILTKYEGNWSIAQMPVVT